MPDWLAPFHLPTFTNDKFQKRKAAYVAKHGYTITIPSWDQIIHLKAENPMTEDEQINYVTHNYRYFSPKRLFEINEMKNRRKRQYQAILGSPTPDAIQNMASVMTAIDDAEDALSTFVAIAKVICTEFPSLASKFVVGPIGWVMMVSSILDSIQMLGRGGLTATAVKSELEKFHKYNPITKKGRVKIAKKLRNFHGSTGDVVEALQVTDNIFGIGLSLGPIMGLAYDLLYGGWRFMMGEKVRIKSNMPLFGEYEKAAARFVKSQIMFCWNWLWQTDVELTRTLISQTFASQWLQTYCKTWNPLDQVHDPQGVQSPAPEPTNPLTIECFTEDGLNPKHFVGWPLINKKWASVEEIYESHFPLNQEAANFALTIKYDDPKIIVRNACIDNTALYTLSACEGEENIFYRHIPGLEKLTTFLAQGKTITWDFPRELIRKVGYYGRYIAFGLDDPDLSAADWEKMFTREMGHEIWKNF